MADMNSTNDDKQLAELKLVSLIHIIALRKFHFLTNYPLISNCSLGCLPNPDKNESVLKSFIVYAIKNHKQNESSILSIFKQALTDGIKSKEVYALAVRI